MLAQFMYLGMTVMAAGNTVISPGCLDLLILQSPVFQPLILEAGLEKPPAPAAAEIIGSVGGHVHKVFLSHNRPDHIPQVFGYGVAITFPDDLARILYGKLDLSLLVPVGIDLQFSFTDPFCIILVNVFNFKIMINVEFFQSCQD